MRGNDVSVVVILGSASRCRLSLALITSISVPYIEVECHLSLFCIIFCGGEQVAVGK